MQFTSSIKEINSALSALLFIIICLNALPYIEILTLFTLQY